MTSSNLQDLDMVIDKRGDVLIDHEPVIHTVSSLQQLRLRFVQLGHRASVQVTYENGEEPQEQPRQSIPNRKPQISALCTLLAGNARQICSQDIFRLHRNVPQAGNSLTMQDPATLRQTQAASPVRTDSRKQRHRTRHGGTD